MASATKPFPAPKTTVEQNTWDSLSVPMMKPTGFREYDARWRFPEEINLVGMQALGLGLATQLHEMGKPVTVAVGNDYRSYSLAIKQALTVGLMAGGAEVHDIGPCITPMAYFAQFDLGVTAVAMATASHNPNGWTGVKMGAEAPLTFGPVEMGRLKEIVMGGEGVAREGGAYIREHGVYKRYLDNLCGDFRMSRKLRVVCATGNGTASAYAPEVLRRIGVDVIESHNTLDYEFPHYNPNPEAMEMLHDMAKTLKETGADLALGFDGDGDRCGVVDDTGEEIFADKVGVIMARDLIKLHPGSTFVADVKSTGLFQSDPVLIEGGAKADYWKTGHSHMKRRVHELGALAGFEKSGHYFLAPPIGQGYDDGMRVAVELCKLLDRNPDKKMSDLRAELPMTYGSPTMSPHCADEEKYEVLGRLQQKLVEMGEKGESLGPRRIKDVVTVNGARVMLDNGAWALVRASSNTPNLVVVCETPESREELRAIFDALDGVIRTEPSVGEYDQRLD
ncbi:MAG: phosphomannomutase/phosphoglucomutase [Paracoccaceae bacterium]